MTVQITISRSTYIKLINQCAETIPFPPIALTPYSALVNYVRSEVTIDVLGAVVDVQPPKYRTSSNGGQLELQEITLINEELKPLVLTLWTDFVTYQGTHLRELKGSPPVLLCRRVRVNPYAGTSLSTTPKSFPFINPPIPPAQGLTTWIADNASSIGVALRTERERASSLDFSLDPDQVFTAVSLLTPMMNSAWIKASVSFIHIPHQFCYLSCPQCSYRTHATLGETFDCNTCKVQQTAVARCRIFTEFSDPSGSIKAAVFEKYAEELLGHSASHIYSLPPEAVTSMALLAESNLKGKEIAAEVKISPKRYGDKFLKCTITHWLFLNVETAAMEVADRAMGSESSTHNAPLKKTLTDSDYLTAPKVYEGQLSSTGVSSFKHGGAITSETNSSESDQMHVDLRVDETIEPVKKLKIN